jgi:cobalamin synthase
MKDRNYGLYALAVAVLVVGALWLGLPTSTLGLLAVVLVCPLMMFFMMKGMHGGEDHTRHSSRSSDDNEPHDHPINR